MLPKRSWKRREDSIERMCAPDGRFSPAFAADLDRLLAWRRDVRRFTDEGLPADALGELVARAVYAPSVGLSQPSRFVRVSDPGRRAAIIAEHQRCNATAAQAYDAERRRRYESLKLAGLREAPEHLAVFTDMATTRGTGLGRQTMPETLAYSTVLAIHTLWLAARARAIGVGWVSILDPHVVARIVDVPETWTFVAYLCVGYPQEEHLDPELVRFGWEHRDAATTLIYER